jgi:hypothetical protein
MIMFAKNIQPPMAMGKAILSTDMKSTGSHRASRKPFVDLISTNHSFKVPVKKGRNNSQGANNITS